MADYATKPSMGETDVLWEETLARLKELRDRPPLPENPYDRLREEMYQLNIRISRIETWQSMWRWLFPVLVVVVIGFIQILLAILQVQVVDQFEL